MRQRRFDHLSYDNLAKLQQTDMVSGMKPSPAQFRAAAETTCVPCVKAQQHKASHPASHSDTPEPLQLLHMDVCGPLPIAARDGSRYFSTFLDDY